MKLRRTSVLISILIVWFGSVSCYTVDKICNRDSLEVSISDLNNGATIGLCRTKDNCTTIHSCQNSACSYKTAYTDLHWTKIDSNPESTAVITQQHVLVQEPHGNPQNHVVFCVYQDDLNDRKVGEIKEHREGAISVYVTDTDGKPVQFAILGTKLILNLIVQQNIYTAMLPYECYFENAFNVSQNFPFVIDDCPLQTHEKMFERMQRTTPKHYTMNFKAFTFTHDSKAMLGIRCKFILCMAIAEPSCDRACWNSSRNYRLRRTPDRSKSSADISDTYVSLVVDTDAPSNETDVSKTSSDDDNTGHFFSFIYGLTAFLVVLFLGVCFGFVSLIWSSARLRRDEQAQRLTDDRQPSVWTTSPKRHRSLIKC